MGEGPASTVTRRGLLGAAGIGAVAAGAALPGHAAASEDDDLAVIARSPVNAQSPEFWPSGDPEDLGAALQNALEYAESNGVSKVLAPAGEYEVDRLRVPSEVHLFGVGEETVLNCGPQEHVAVRLGESANAPNAERITLSDLKIVGDQSGTPGYGDAAVAVYAPGSRVERVTVVSSRGGGIGLYGRVSGGKVIDCRVVDPIGMGIYALQQYPQVTQDLEGPEFRGNIVEAGSGTQDRGIKIARYPGTTSRWLSPRLIDNRVSVPSGSPGLCIELWGGASVNPVVSGNRTSGGSMGISINHAPHASVSGNLAKGWSYAGIEIACGDTSTVPDDDEHRPGSRWMSVTGNVLDGGGDGSFGQYGIAASVYHDEENLTGLSVSGNVTTRCMIGIVVYGTNNAVVNGNAIDCVDDPDAYTQDDTVAADWANYWAGIVLRHSSRSLVCSGNFVIGHGKVPAGIRLDNAVDVVCTGNVITDVHLDRDIYLRASSPARAQIGDGTRGVIHGNVGRVAWFTSSGGGIEDLRVAENQSDLPTLTPVAGRLVIPASPRVAKVNGSGNITSIVGYYPAVAVGYPPSERSYPSREVTLVFENAVTIKDGDNISLGGGDFAAQPGDTLTLICDGLDWFEVAKA